VRKTNKELKEIGLKCFKNKALYDIAHMKMSNNIENKKSLVDDLNKTFSKTATKQILLAIRG